MKNVIIWFTFVLSVVSSYHIHRLVQQLNDFDAILVGLSQDFQESEFRQNLMESSINSIDERITAVRQGQEARR